jgi:hypothetical protein
MLLSPHEPLSIKSRTKSNHDQMPNWIPAGFEATSLIIMTLHRCILHAVSSALTTVGGGGQKGNRKTCLYLAGGSRCCILEQSTDMLAATTC